jgi:hypothetical protein
MEDLRARWSLIESDLLHARQTLPDSAAGDESVRLFHEFIDHELELDCNMLEQYARTHSVSNDFWIALRMPLPRWVW